jgi:TonB family protein
MPGPGGVRVSGETDIPIVCGLFRPAVILPLESAEWPEARLESVLRHERMHIARRDTLSQALAQITCALYWPQPLVWLAASSIRNACEQACDDGVLSQGTKASDYAGHLMDIAHALNSQTSAALEGGIAMTRTSQLEERISALLNSKRDRRQAGASFAATVTALAVTAVIALAAFRTPLLAQSGKLAGLVRDSSGAVVPSARIDIRGSAGSPATQAFHEILRSNAIGEFSFDTVPDGTYDITITAPGFAKQEHQGVLFEGGKAKHMDIELQVGSIRETVSVQAQGGPLPPQRIRVGGNVQAANLIHKVTPLYPSGAKMDRVEGVVILKAVISKEGNIISLEQVNKLVDPRLAESAMDAVKLWQYKPTLLNGAPIEVVTEIEVNFTLTK